MAHDPDLAATSQQLALLPPSSAPASQELHQRLMASVGSGAMRFAPFFERLSSLFDLPEERVIDILESCDDEKRWRRIPLPGIRVFSVPSGPGCAGRRSLLASFRPGVWFPRHAHQGTEIFFTIQGAYRDSSGTTYSAGDMQETGPSSAHGFRVVSEETCVIAIVHEGLLFDNLVLRWFSRLLECPAYSPRRREPP